MKKNLLLPLFVYVLCLSLNAQRNCNLEVKILTPLPNFSIVNGQNLGVKYILKNLGPDNVIGGDSVFVDWSIDNALILGSENLLTFSKGIMKDSILTISYNFTPKNFTIGTSNLCINSSFINKNINRVIDNNLTNNKSCQTVTIADNNTNISTTKTNLQSFTLKPNPAKDNVIISLYTEETSLIVIQLLDLKGKLISKTNHKLEKGLNNISINTTQFSSGIYYFKLIGNNINSTSKLIIE